MGVITKLVSLGRQPPEKTYACQQCGAEFDLRYYRCPTCGSYRVERAEWCLA